LIRSETVAVGDMHAVVLVLADAQSWARQFVHVFISVYILLIFAYVLSSWVRIGYSPTLARVQRFLHDTCDPYLRIFRRFIPLLGPIDISPIVGVVVLVVIDQVLTSVI
jgi:YggT family protein